MVLEKSIIYAWEDRYLGLFPADTYTTESRVGATFCVSLDGSDIEVQMQDGRRLMAPSFVIARSTPVEIKSQSPALFLNCFPLSLECFSLLEFVKDAGIRPVKTNFHPTVDWVKAVLNQTIQEMPLHRAITDMLFSIDGYVPVRKQIDLRILHVIKCIQQALPDSQPIERYAQDVRLSPDRLSHLFKEHMGYSIKSYTLFEKARKALFLMVKGDNFTSASMDAGFTDVAHFANTVKKFYGLKLSEISGTMDVTVFAKD